MADIIRLNGDTHAQTQHLLPWYVTGALAGKELALVETHLAECAECREDAEIEKTLARHVKTLPRDVDRGWRTLWRRFRAERSGKIPLIARHIPIAWALAAQVVSLVTLFSLMTLAFTRPPPPRPTASPFPAAISGNLIVIFKPTSTEASMRTVLLLNQARIVGGPTAADAYVLQVAPDQRSAVLERLRTDRSVSFAEKIGGSDP